MQSSRALEREGDKFCIGVLEVSRSLENWYYPGRASGQSVKKPGHRRPDLID